ncbi:MAG: hypothetical protein HQL77_19175, partial [Magnetococcales bacterium]|nr:hypothetical protein [Magnetococcales bacterium]
SRGISEKDNSPNAANARRINGLADLDGIEFIAKIDVEKDKNDNDKNVIKFAITPDHKEYQNHTIGGGTATTPPIPSVPIGQSGWQQNGQQPPQQGWQPPAQQQPPQQSQTAPSQGVPPRPQWAQ